MPRDKAVNLSANQTLPNSFMESELNILPGERRGIHVIQHNTNDTKTWEKPGYMTSGLAFSTDVDHRNNSKASNQATMNNMGMERPIFRQGNSQDRPQDCCCCCVLHLHSDGTMNTLMIVTLTQHIIFSILCWTGSRPVSCDSRPDSPMLEHCVLPLPWSNVTICSRPAWCLTSRTFLVYSRWLHLDRLRGHSRLLLQTASGQPCLHRQWWAGIDSGEACCNFRSDACAEWRGELSFLCCWEHWYSIDPTPYGLGGEDGERTYPSLRIY